HAWCEVYLPGAGWIGLDATSGLLAAEGHIPLASTPDPGNAAPISGSHDPCDSQFQFEMRVERYEPVPEKTRPYSTATWAAVDALGMAVDTELRRSGVQLTMGGEPTFVFADDPDAAEWNVAALGPGKRLLGARLLYRLHKRLAPRGLLFHGQGKWYPGEVLPRWALGLYYRADGLPVWERTDLLAREDNANAAPDPKLAGDVAQDLMKAIALEFGIQDSYIRSARDPRDLESSAGPLDPLPAIRGYALPLRWWPERETWISSRWSELSDPIVLMPGDSPMGYRLPLGALGPESIPGGDTAAEIYAAPPALPRELRDEPITAADFEQLLRSAQSDPAAVSLSTALCVEARDNALYIFLPPQTSLEVWLRLIKRIEAAVIKTGLPVFLEGYPPPRDPRLQTLLVTPDPGVIEVNVPPVQSWPEQRELTLALGSEAAAIGLVSAKFQLDGRPVGSGGGNHITLGGPVPAESPFLNRPSLLRSLVTYFQHHPALSYLFSGMFLGATSQAPRIDEGRHESLYELEIAFQNFPRDGSLPWLIDRLLRHHLTDLAGNTHRAEICIDKLYAPDRSDGRLGIVELRAFEMLPQPRENLVVALLIRAIIARLLKSGYQMPFKRFGTALQDQYMLPFYLEQDLYSILADLKQFGFHFKPEFFKPILDFRFPLCGRLQVAGVELEIRAALEPWHVLGEESIFGQTARMVDSAVERLQVQARHLDPDRYAVLCNGFQVPLQPATSPDIRLAGVRFKAWHLVHTLHPNVKVHAPLVFEVVDLAAGQSLGGATWHVSHPGGRNFEERPINAREAESRWESRFRPGGHTPGPLVGKDGTPAADYPHTLDLRRLDP
ncbi:MAG: transglutaminase family protein, partial [Leptospiraceae bacterium]|nr:transglutaminase family protein [Leptospiraceae bacterium]